VSASGASGTTELTTAFAQRLKLLGTRGTVGDLRSGGQRVHERVLADEVREVANLLFETVYLRGEVV
jgi:hypothetical protein